jgi:hypothetical protein
MKLNIGKLYIIRTCYEGHGKVLFYVPDVRQQPKDYISIRSDTIIVPLEVKRVNSMEEDRLNHSLLTPTQWYWINLYCVDGIGWILFNLDNDWHLEQLPCHIVNTLTTVVT